MMETFTLAKWRAYDSDGNEIASYNKKGNDNMHRDILELYKINQEMSIRNKYKTKREELISNNKIVKEFEKLENEFIESLDNLYLSQFEDGVAEGDINNSELILVRTTHSSYTTKYGLNYNFTPEEAVKLIEKEQEELDNLRETLAAASALLNICSHKSEIEEILMNYEIIDKKTKKINLV